MNRRGTMHFQMTDAALKATNKALSKEPRDGTKFSSPNESDLGDRSEDSQEKPGILQPPEVRSVPPVQ